ncbi:vitamin B12 transporter BtuB [Bacteroidaceae bacterium]|nr:vitamin B12 transporter BtuB [Bacteroidaceae bacterium]
MAIDYYLQWTYLCTRKLICSIMKYVHRIEKWGLWLVMLSACLQPISAQSHRPHSGHHDSRIFTWLSGRVMEKDSTAVSFANVYLKNTNYGGFTDDKGRFRFKVPIGTHTLTVSLLGYEPVKKNITVRSHGMKKLVVVLQPVTTELEEVIIHASGVSRVQRSPFNAVAIDTKALQNTTKSLSDALSLLPGMKLRESGGVGSDMRLMLDGFSGKHVKVFIDGVPQEGVGQAFDLNNIPAGFAERIEVYKGVVPVGFGTDAIGGVVNIVTDKRHRSWHADASYSYGSFNTHRSNLRFGQTTKDGFLYAIEAFQNYSDNNYYIDNWVREFEVQPDGTIHKFPVDKNDKKHVRRFNDAFHNEAVLGKLGLVGKKWADRFVLGFSWSNFYKEIQTGVYQEIVFGKKHRKGHSLSPSLEYVKHDLFTPRLDLLVSANYNHNITHNIDTAARYYNWYGQYYEKDSRGEQSYQNSESKNANWNTTLTLKYRISDIHTLTFNHVYSDFRRMSRSHVGTSSVLTDFSIPKITRKNIGGFSYRVIPSERWNASAFVKYYLQYNRGPVSRSTDGVGDYVSLGKSVSAWGYGAAGTYYVLKELQAKLSYERAFRLPTTDELFGDEDLEAGRADLKPEKSDNFNMNFSYNGRFGSHGLYADVSLIYRNTKDYIKRGLGKHGSTQYGIYENHGHVRTKGYNVSLRYSFARRFDLGGTWNSIDTRDYERNWTGSSQQENMHYKIRMPNIPYRFANFDANFHWRNLFAKGNTLTVGYEGFWQHAFPLNWENIGNKDSKAYVPDQLSHNLSLLYSIKNGRYNISLECRNLTNARLYDNFSLQKAGRAFYVKARVHFGN